MSVKHSLSYMLPFYFFYTKHTTQMQTKPLFTSCYLYTDLVTNNEFKKATFHIPILHVCNSRKQLKRYYKNSIKPANQHNQNRTNTFPKCWWRVKR